MMNDLFVLSPPRCMSTIISNNIIKATNLNNNNVDGNEFLNSRNIKEPFNKRHKRYSEIKPDEYKWDYSGLQKRLLKDLVDDDKSYMMKDVLYPNVVSDFVKKHKQKTIIIYKYPPLAAYSIILKGWQYITNIHGRWHRAALLYDMVNAVQMMYDQHFANIIFEPYVEVVKTKKVQQNPDYLWDKVEKLGFNVNRFDYITDKFKQKTKEVEGYKETKLYNKIEKRYINNVNVKDINWG